MGNNQSAPQPTAQYEADDVSEISEAVEDDYSSTAHQETIDKFRAGAARDTNQSDPGTVGTPRGDLQVHCFCSQTLRPTQERGCVVALGNLLGWNDPRPCEDEPEDRIEEEIVLVSASGQTKKNFPGFVQVETETDVSVGGDADTSSVAEDDNSKSDVDPEVAPESNNRSSAQIPRHQKNYFPPVTSGDVDWKAVRSQRLKVNTQINYNQAAPVSQAGTPRRSETGSVESEDFVIPKLGAAKVVSRGPVGRPPMLPSNALLVVPAEPVFSKNVYDNSTLATPRGAIKAGTPCANQFERTMFLQKARVASISPYNNPYAEDFKEEREHALWVEKQKRLEAEEARKRTWVGSMTPRRAAVNKHIDGSVSNVESSTGASFFRKPHPRSVSESVTFTDEDYEKAKSILANTSPDVAAKSDLKELVFGRENHSEQFNRINSERIGELEKETSKRTSLGLLSKSKRGDSKRQGGELLSEEMISVDLAHCVSRQEAAVLKKRIRRKPKELIGWEIVVQRSDGRTLGTWVVTGLRKHTYSGNDFRISRIDHDDVWTKLSTSAKPGKSSLGFRPIRKVIGANEAAAGADGAGADGAGGADADGVKAAGAAKKKTKKEKSVSSKTTEDLSSQSSKENRAAAAASELSRTD